MNRYDQSGKQYVSVPAAFRSLWVKLATALAVALAVATIFSSPAQAFWQVLTIPNLPPGAGLGQTWARTPNDVYVWASRTTPATADTPESALFHWNGTTWSAVLSLPGHAPGAVFGTGAAEVIVSTYRCASGYAAGCGPDIGGRIYRSEDGGANWSEDPLPSVVGARPITHLSGTPGNVHALAATNFILRFDGSAWSTVFSGFDDSQGKPQALTLLSANEGYFVTCWGWGRWDGTVWTFHGVQSSFCDVNSVWGTRDASGALHLYTVGNQNFSNGVRVWRFDEQSQSFASTPVFSDGNGANAGSGDGIWGSGPNDVYVIGRLEPGPSNGRLYHFDGTSWQRVTAVDPIPSTRGIWGTGPADVWVPLSNGQILHLVEDYVFTGFLQPVDNAPILNTVKAGQAIPVKFSLGGDRGLNILAAGSPASQQIACAGGQAVDEIEQTVTAGSSSLSYNAATGQYTYVWKSDKAWKNTCRQLVLTLADGSTHTASFNFK